MAGSRPRRKKWAITRNFDRNGEYRDIIDKEFSDKMDMESLLEFSAHLPPEARKKLVDKAIEKKP